jgi:hypothetical protein
MTIKCHVKFEWCICVGLAYVSRTYWKNYIGEIWIILPFLSICLDIERKEVSI